MRPALLTVLGGLMLAAAACTTAGAPVADPAATTTTATVTVTTTRVPATVTVTAGPAATSGAPTSARSDELDYKTTVAGIEQVLTSNGATGYGLAHVTDVVCPPNMPILVGQMYDCTVRVGVERETVTITIRTATGQFEVGAPH